MGITYAPGKAPEHPKDSGHGHVKPRADGMKARCGGPLICPVCALEQAQAHAEDKNPFHG